MIRSATAKKTSKVRITEFLLGITPVIEFSKDQECGNCPTRMIWSINHKSKIQIDMNFSNCKWALWRIPKNIFCQNELWFTYCLGAVRQRTIDWANVDQDVCRNMASPGHNEWVNCLNCGIPPTRKPLKWRLNWLFIYILFLYINIHIINSYALPA